MELRSFRDPVLFGKWHIDTMRYLESTMYAINTDYTFIAIETWKQNRCVNRWDRETEELQQASHLQIQAGCTNIVVVNTG